MEGLLWHSVLAIFAGLLLNFTPCVLPVIPFKIQAVLREIGNDLNARILAALSLLAGTVSFFFALGGGTAYLGLRWGSLFQSKPFLLGLSLFLAVSAIGTFFDWTFRLPQILYKVPIHRYVGAYLTGALAGILSTPCAGPFLGSVLAYSVTQSVQVILIIFASIGFGLSLPYILILIWPRLLTRLPLVRSWATQVKPILSFILLAGAIFFAQILLAKPWSSVLWITLCVAIALWVLTALKTARSWPERILPVLTAIVPVLIFLLLGSSTQNGALEWTLYSTDQPLKALTAHRPALLEFTADWCLNCRVLEKTTYQDPEVIKAVQRHGFVLIRGDMTDFDKNKEDLLKEFGGTAIPYAVLLNQEGQVVQTFSGMFTASALTAAINEVGGRKPE